MNKHEKEHLGKELEAIRAQDQRFPKSRISHFMTAVQRETYKQYLMDKAGLV